MPFNFFRTGNLLSGSFLAPAVFTIQPRLLFIIPRSQVQVLLVPFPQLQLKHCDTQMHAKAASQLIIVWEEN